MSWIAISPSNTLEEHHYGIKTKNSEGKYINQWMDQIGGYLTSEDVGYRWIFLYERDNEQPIGMRVCWQPANHYNPIETDPIKIAEKDYKYIILPQFKLVCPPASDVEIIHVEQQERNSNKKLMDQMFSIINITIQKRAQQGFDYAFIPWESLGKPIEIQKLFFNEKEIFLKEIETNSIIVGNKMTSLFSYGKFKNGYYSTDEEDGISFKTYQENEYDLGFFNDNTYSNDDYISPASGKTFTIYDLITNIKYLGYGLSFYGAIDTAASTANTPVPYCDGICIVWSKDASNTAQIKAQSNYNTLLANYQTSSVIEYTTLDAPILDDYENACRKNNSAYLQALVTAINSKMTVAFSKHERAIYILWSEINSAHPEIVRKSWESNDTYKYDGKFPPMHKYGNELYEDYTGNLSSAFCYISRGSQYYTALPSNIYYTWAYCWYNKNGKEGFPSLTGAQIQNISDESRNPAGIVISLCGKSSTETESTAQLQVAKAIRKVQQEVFSITDPSQQNK